MQIFNIFSAFILLILVIKVFLLLKNKEIGDEKITKAFDLFIAILLVSVSWFFIYYIFGYNTKKDSREAIDDYQKSNTSVVKFADDKK